MSNLNEAVRLIIERLKTNPEDFWGELRAQDDPTISKQEYPKFRSIARDIEYLLTGPREGDLVREKNAMGVFWFLTDEEKAALTAAYTEAKRERFTAEIFHTLLTKPEPNPYSTATGMYAQQLAASIVQTKNTAASQIISSYGQAPIKSEGGSV